MTLKITKAAKNNIVRKGLFLSVLFLVLINNVYSQCKTTINSSPLNWSSTTWGGAGCSQTPNTNGSYYGNIEVAGLTAGETLNFNRNITFSNSLTFSSSGSVNNPAVFILKANQTLTISNSLSLPDNFRLIIEAGATLNVSNSISGGKNVEIEILGTLTTPQITLGKDSKITAQTGSTLTVSNNVTMGNGAEFIVNSNISITTVNLGDESHLTIGPNGTLTTSNSTNLGVNSILEGPGTLQGSSLNPGDSTKCSTNGCPIMSFWNCSNINPAMCSNVCTPGGTTVGAAGNITGAATVCQGQTEVSYSVAPITNAKSYLWTLPAGATIVSGANTNQIRVSFADNALGGNMTVKGVACTSYGNSKSLAITVNPLPKVTTQPADKSVCESRPTTFTIAASNVASYRWQVNTGSGFTDLANVAPYSNVTSNTLNLATTPNTFNGYTYRCKITNGCGTRYSNPAVLTVLYPILTATSGCPGETVYFKASGATKFNVYFEQTGGPLASTMDTAYSTPIGTSDISFWVTAVGPDNCESSPRRNITAFSYPKPILTTTNITICSPETGDLTKAFTDSNNDTKNAIATITYWSNATATNAVTTPTSVSAGTYYIKKEISNGCSDIKPVVVKINAKPNVNITNPAQVCSGTVNIRAAAVTTGSTTGLTFTYWRDSAATISMTNGQAGAISVSGQYWIKGTVASTGCFDIKPVTVTVNAVPVGGTVSPDTICSGSATTLELQGQTGLVVKWQISSNGTNFTDITSSAGLINFNTGNLTATRYYRAVVQNGNCTAVNSSIAKVTVNPNPTLTLPSNYNICNGKIITPNLASNIAGSTISWINSNPAIFINVSGTNWQVENTSNATVTTTINVTATAPTGCFTTGSFQITVDPVNEWIGGTSSAWNNPLNWCGGVPTANQNVVIPGGTANQPNVSSNATCRNLTVATAASLTIGNATLTVEGASQINGALVFDNSASKIVYNGPSAYNGSWTDNAAGSVVYNNNVAFNKGITSRSSIIVNGQLTFPSNNKIKMTDNAVLTLGKTATYTGASRTSFIEGKLSKITASTTPFIFPLGIDTLYRRIGVIPQTNAETTFTIEYIKKSTKTRSNATTTKDDSIYFISDVEYWEINRPTGSAAKVIMYWGEGSVVNENGDFRDLRVAHLNTSTNHWEMFGVDVFAGSSPFSGYMTTKQYLTSFSPIAACGTTSTQTLPVALKNFILSKENSRVQLDWETSSESNNAGFEIQRSTDGFKTFETIGFVEGSGSSVATSSYTFTDASASGTMVFYRLKQIDFEQKATFSEVKYIMLSKLVGESMIYPNPTTGIVIVTIDGIETETKVEYSIIGSDGLVKVLKRKMTGKDVSCQLSKDIQNLKNGAYTIIITTAKERHSIKLIRI
jgi:hypothetical protein